MSLNSLERHLKSYKRSLLGILLLVPAMAMALPSDREQPIEIESDSADIDNKKGVSVYRGDVVMIQGSTRITGDVVTVYTENQEVQKIVAEGFSKRAYYEEEQPDTQGTLQAWGHTIDYKIQDEKIHLVRQAQLVQKGDSFKGERIDYDLKLQKVNAKGQENKQGEGRVQMVIQPKTEKQEKK